MMGAEAIKRRSFDLEAEAEALKGHSEPVRSKRTPLWRLKVVNLPDHRATPVGYGSGCCSGYSAGAPSGFQLDGGRFATSDLYDLYRRVINP